MGILSDVTNAIGDAITGAVTGTIQDIIGVNRRSISSGTTQHEAAKSSYNASWPDNNVFKTASGHTIEFDDTEGEERIHIFHASGSRVEMNKDGQIAIEAVGNLNITCESLEIGVAGDAQIVAGGNMTLAATRIDLNP